MPNEYQESGKDQKVRNNRSVVIDKKSSIKIQEDKRIAWIKIASDISIVFVLIANIILLIYTYISNSRIERKYIAENVPLVDMGAIPFSSTRSIRLDLAPVGCLA